MMEYNKWWESWIISSILSMTLDDDEMSSFLILLQVSSEKLICEIDKTWNLKRWESEVKWWWDQILKCWGDGDRKWKMRRRHFFDMIKIFHFFISACLSLMTIKDDIDFFFSTFLSYSHFVPWLNEGKIYNIFMYTKSRIRSLGNFISIFIPSSKVYWFSKKYNVVVVVVLF